MSTYYYTEMKSCIFAQWIIYLFRNGYNNDYTLTTLNNSLVFTNTHLHSYRNLLSLLNGKLGTSNKKILVWLPPTLTSGSPGPMLLATHVLEMRIELLVLLLAAAAVALPSIRTCVLIVEGVKWRRWWCQVPPTLGGTLPPKILMTGNTKALNSFQTSFGSQWTLNACGLEKG